MTIATLRQDLASPDRDPRTRAVDILARIHGVPRIRVLREIERARRNVAPQAYPDPVIQRGRS